MSTIDTLQASETLSKAGFKKVQAKALIQALSPSEDKTVSRHTLDAAINKLKAELVVWMVGLQIAGISVLVALLG